MRKGKAPKHRALTQKKMENSEVLTIRKCFAYLLGEQPGIMPRGATYACRISELCQLADTLQRLQWVDFHSHLPLRVCSLRKMLHVGQSFRIHFDHASCSLRKMLHVGQSFRIHFDHASHQLSTKSWRLCNFAYNFTRCGQLTPVTFTRGGGQDSMLGKPPIVVTNRAPMRHGISFPDFPFASLSMEWTQTYFHHGGVFVRKSVSVQGDSTTWSEASTFKCASASESGAGPRTTFPVSSY